MSREYKPDARNPFFIVSLTTFFNSGANFSRVSEISVLSRRQFKTAFFQPFFNGLNSAASAGYKILVVVDNF